MATRYLISIPTNSGLSQQILPRNRDLTGFSRFDLSAGSAVYINSDEHISIAGDGGLVIGRLFTKSSRPEAMRRLDGENANRVRKTGGGELIQMFWGSYVAVLVDSSGAVSVIRDPSGAMPAYYVEHMDGLFFASDPDLLVDAGLLTPKIDWQNLADHLVARDLRTSKTCLVGLAELMAGHRLKHSKDGNEIAVLWSPWKFVKPIGNYPDEALADGLFETVSGTVQALASGYRSILLGVSGGLDSSIVAAGLKRNSSPLTCFTFATHEPEGDERAQARSLCSHLDLPLVERFHELSRVDIERATSAHLPRPVGHPFGQSVSSIKFELEKAYCADAIFTGIGGDNVFCFTQSATPLVDRYLAGGISPGLLTTLTDICQQNQASIGEVIKMASERHSRKDPTYVWEGDRKFLMRTADEELKPRVDHPWLDTPAGALPGKAVHIAMLARLQGTNDGLDRSRAPQLTPLVAQPVMEACLAIPTWKWVAGGRNRSVARQAFVNVLPPTVLNRQSKGGPNGFAYEVMEHHKAALCDRLICGRLANAGLLDLEAILAAMAPSRLITPPDHMYLSHLAEAEAWVHHWEQKARPCRGEN